MTKDFSEYRDKIIKRIQNDGKSKGLTEDELKKLKRAHWDRIYSSLVWAFRGLLTILGVWIVVVLILYTIALAQSDEYLKTVFETTVKGAILVLATIGFEKTVTGFFKR